MCLTSVAALGDATHDLSSKGFTCWGLFEEKTGC